MATDATDDRLVIDGFGMTYAIGLTAIGLGCLLIYAGFKDVNLWQTFLSVVNPGSQPKASE